MAFIGIKEVNIGDKVKVHTKHATYTELSVGDIVEVETLFDNFISEKDRNYDKLVGYLIGCDKRESYMPNTINREEKVVVLSMDHPDCMNNSSHDYYFDCKKIPCSAVDTVNKVR